MKLTESCSETRWEESGDIEEPGGGISFDQREEDEKTPSLPERIKTKLLTSCLILIQTPPSRERL